jgi:hypothetical protein
MNYFKTWEDFARRGSAVGGRLTFSSGGTNQTRTLSGASAADLTSLCRVESLQPQWLTLAIQGRMFADFGSALISPWWQVEVEWGSGNTTSHAFVNVGHGTQLAFYASTLRAQVRATVTGFEGFSLAGGGLGLLGDLVGHIAPGTPPGGAYTPLARFTASAGIIAPSPAFSDPIPIPEFAIDVVLVGFGVPPSAGVAIRQLNRNGDIIAATGHTDEPAPARILPNASHVQVANTTEADANPAWLDFGLAL